MKFKNKFEGWWIYSKLIGLGLFFICTLILFGFFCILFWIGGTLEKNTYGDILLTSALLTFLGYFINNE